MNLIDAIINLVSNPVTELTKQYKSKNRANQVGDALEEYVKDLFAGTFNMPETERLQTLSQVFSYLGNNSNPPDAMLRHGDAIEVKKIGTDTASLALNSSHPKQMLFADNQMLSTACKSAEDWEQKDILYIVGVVKDDCLRNLCMVYGRDYCAEDSCYSRIKERIKAGVSEIHGINFTESRELGHVNKVDPLGITYLRVRGMWGIENPWKVFSYVYERDRSKQFSFMCIVNEDKWNTFENTQQLLTLAEQHPSLYVEQVKIKNPDNPAQLRDARLIHFSI